MKIGQYISSFVSFVSMVVIVLAVLLSILLVGFMGIPTGPIGNDINDSQKLDYLLENNKYLINETRNTQIKIDVQASKITEMNSTISNLERTVDKETKQNVLLSIISFFNSILFFIIGIPSYLLLKTCPNKTEKKLIELIEKYKSCIVIIVIAIVVLNFYLIFCQ